MIQQAIRISCPRFPAVLPAHTSPGSFSGFDLLDRRGGGFACGRGCLFIFAEGPELGQRTGALGAEIAQSLGRRDPEEALGRFQIFRDGLRRPRRPSAWAKRLWARSGPATRESHWRKPNRARPPAGLPASLSALSKTGTAARPRGPSLPRAVAADSRVARLSDPMAWLRTETASSAGRICTIARSIVRKLGTFVFGGFTTFGRNQGLGRGDQSRRSRSCIGSDAAQEYDGHGRTSGFWLSRAFARIGTTAAVGWRPSAADMKGRAGTSTLGNLRSPCRQLKLRIVSTAPARPDPSRS